MRTVLRTSLRRLKFNIRVKAGRTLEVCNALCEPAARRLRIRIVSGAAQLRLSTRACPGNEPTSAEVP